MATFNLNPGNKIIMNGGGIVLLNPLPYKPVSHYVASGDLATSLLDKISTRHLTNTNGAAGNTVYDASAWYGSPGIVLPYNGTAGTSSILFNSNYTMMTGSNVPFTIAIVCSRPVIGAAYSSAFWSGGGSNFGFDRTTNNAPQQRSVIQQSGQDIITFNPNSLLEKNYAVYSYDGTNLRYVIYTKSELYESFFNGTQTQPRTTTNLTRLILMGYQTNTTYGRCGEIFKEALIYDKALTSDQCENLAYNFLPSRWDNIPTLPIDPADPLDFFKHRFVANNTVAETLTDKPGNDTVVVEFGPGAPVNINPNGWAAGISTMTLPTQRGIRFEGQIHEIPNVILGKQKPWLIAISYILSTGTTLFSWAADDVTTNYHYLNISGGGQQMARRGPSPSISFTISPYIAGKNVAVISFDGMYVRAIVNGVMSIVGSNGITPLTVDCFLLNGAHGNNNPSLGFQLGALYVHDKAANSTEMTQIYNALVADYPL
jgi:hypothetical protein